MAAYPTPRLDPKNLETGRNRIWAEADKVDGKFSTMKDHVTMRRTFGTGLPFLIFFSAIFNEKID